MKKLVSVLLALFFLVLPKLSQAQENKGPKDKRMPFSKVIYKKDQAYIEVDHQWGKIRKIEGKAIDVYLEMAKDFFPTDWKRGFHRYLHYLLDELEIERAESLSVSYELKGKLIRKDFLLTEENRELATAYHDSIVTLNRIERQHTKQIPKNLSYLTKRIDGPTATDKVWLTKEEAIADLEYLEWEIQHNYSYANLNGFDYQLALDAIRNNLATGISKRDFAYQLKMLMANFGDGHSRVSIQEVVHKAEKKGLPFEIIYHDHKFYAVNTIQKTFFDAAYPQILSINDIPIDHLFELSKRMVAKTTSKYISSNATSYLRYTTLMLKLAGATKLDQVEVGFANGNEKKKQVFTLARYPRAHRFTNYYLKDSLLTDKIAYLAFNEYMYDEDQFINGLHESMQQFRESKGLIIDIRRNPGGSRAALRALLPYFIKEAKVVNVARYRIDKEQDFQPKYGYLEARYAYPANIDLDLFPDATDRKEMVEFKKAVQSFQANFKAAREVSDEQFTDYHFMCIDPTAEEQAYYYPHPVIVLIDEGCFSASDIFAAGIRQGDQVRLLGNTTGGGSGFSKSKKLPNSRLKLKLSRMFSYQPNGALYDGHGVIPDIELDYTLEDKLGQTDTQLRQAITLLKKS